MPRDDEIQAAYAALGRFLQAFAHSCWSLQNLILSILRLGGLQDQQMAWIILGNRAIAANALIDMAQHLVGHLSGRQDEPIFADIAKRFRTLSENRNDLMHGITFVGWGNEQTADWSKFEAFKISSNRRGSDLKQLPGSPEEFQPWISEAEEIAESVHPYMGCLLAGLELENNFVQRDGHWRGTAQPQR